MTTTTNNETSKLIKYETYLRKEIAKANSSCEDLQEKRNEVERSSFPSEDAKNAARFEAKFEYNRAHRRYVAVSNALAILVQENWDI